MIDLQTYLKERLEEGSLTLRGLGAARCQDAYLFDIWDDYIAFLEDYPDKYDVLQTAINEVLIRERNREKKKS